MVAIIPARGGSKGIPRKNIKPLAGKPLIGWTVEAARQARGIDRIVVSTDDEEIAAVAMEFGAEVPFLRPAELATDETPGIAPVLHALERLTGVESVLVLQPTSPLRSVIDIEGIIQLCTRERAPSAVSVSEVSKHPFWMYQKDSENHLHPLVRNNIGFSRRQDLPQAYVLNGALYLARVDWLFNRKEFIGPETVGFVMPNERSVDLDTMFDWRWAEYLIENKYV